MNEEMKVTWLEISEMLGEPTPEELSVFLRTWQRAIQAEREECAKAAETLGVHPALNVFAGGPDWYKHGKEIAAVIRARGQA
jgi:hypothetical protein